MQNLAKHLENLQLFGVPVLVAINTFPNDDAEEVRAVRELCSGIEVPAVVSEVFRRGGEGGMEMAEAVLKIIGHRSKMRYLYSLNMSVKEKIERIATFIYGAKRVVYNMKAEEDISRINDMGLDDLPICMAKTQYSLSDDPKMLGRPRNFKIRVREVRVCAGAGFLVPVTGSITTMPGLPRRPAAESMNIDGSGRIEGLF